MATGSLTGSKGQRWFVSERLSKEEIFSGEKLFHRQLLFQPWWRKEKLRWERATVKMIFNCQYHRFEKTVGKEGQHMDPDL